MMVSKTIKKSPLGKNLKKRLDKSRSRRAEVNVGKIGKLTQKGESVIVPGKVLGTGNINHSVHVYAISFSESARKKIEQAGGKALGIDQLQETKARMMA